MTLFRQIYNIFFGDRTVMFSAIKIQKENNTTGKILPLKAWTVTISSLVTRCILIILTVLTSLFLPAQRRIIYLSSSSDDTYNHTFTGCKGNLRFFRFCPPDADAAPVKSNFTKNKTKARIHRKDGTRLSAFQDIPTINVKDLKIQPRKGCVHEDE